MNEPRAASAAKKRRSKRKSGPPASLHPVSPLPSMLIRLHQLRRGTYATDFGLDAIFARRP